MKAPFSPNSLSRIHAHREHPTIEPRALAEFSGKALLANYAAIQEQVPDQAILPMVKANAYGHGMEWVARMLLDRPGLYGFGVATLEEGAELRSSLGPRARRTRIIVFSGATPWSEAKGEFCERYALTPVIGSDEDWRLFVRQGWPERLSYEIKFNTGMSRLGMSPGMARKVRKDIAALGSSDAHPRGIMTHLAMGETPDAKLSLLQRERFEAIRRELESAMPAAHFHMANSAAIWNQKHFRLQGLTDVVRPGLSLYGIVPWMGAPRRGIEPVMKMMVSVVAVHRLRKGERIGYGGTPVGEDCYAAILGAGYADGVKRAFSNQGFAWLERAGKETRFMGTVSMDLCAVRCVPQTRPGDWVQLIGPEVDAWAQARAAGTIPYELLTSLSSRVHRRYGSSS